MSTGDQWGKAILIGCGAIIVLAGMAVAGLVALGIWATPDDVEIAVEAPTFVAVGEQFQIVARMTNTAAEPQSLYSLDIADRYLEGVAIEAARPRFTDSYHVPIDNTWSYTFDLEVGPGEEVVVVLDATAVRPGDFQGDVDFCINNGLSFVSHPLRIVVQPGG